MLTGLETSCKINGHFQPTARNLLHCDEVGSKQNQHKQSILCHQLKIQLSLIWFQKWLSQWRTYSGFWIQVLTLDRLRNVASHNSCEAIMTLSMPMIHSVLACVKGKTRGVIPTNNKKNLNLRRVKHFTVQFSVLTSQTLFAIQTTP